MPTVWAGAGRGPPRAGLFCGKHVSASGEALPSGRAAVTSAVQLRGWAVSALLLVGVWCSRAARADVVIERQLRRARWLYRLVSCRVMRCDDAA